MTSQEIALVCDWSLCKFQGVKLWVFHKFCVGQKVGVHIESHVENFVGFLSGKSGPCYNLSWSFTIIIVIYKIPVTEIVCAL